MKISVKKTVLLDKSELNKLDVNNIYINIIFYYNKPVFSGSPKSKDKIYLNLSGFYLKDREYLEEIIIPKDESPIKNLKKNIKNKYNLKDKIINIKYLFNKNNVYYVIINLNSMPEFIEDFRWITKFDFYKIDTDNETEDLFENIIINNSLKTTPKLKNNLNLKFKTKKYLNSNTNLYHIYNSMIGDYPIKTS
jgi:hypothetical protein